MTSPIAIVGNVTNDPELKFVGSGAAVCNFSVAVTERVKDGDSWVDGDTTFYRCAAWRTLGENLAESLTKGTRVLVVGGFKSREYETNGEKRLSLEVTVEHCGTELRFATASVQRAGGGGGRGNATRQQTQAAPNPAPTGVDPWAQKPNAADMPPPF